MTGSILLALLPLAHAAEPTSAGQAPALIGGSLLVVAIVAAILFRKAADGVLAACAAGALTTVYLTVQHFVAKSGGSSVCNVSSVINCDAVNTSQFSELGGVAISIYGLGFYAAMGYLAFRAKVGRSPHAHTLLLLGALGAVGYDAFLAWAMIAKIGAYCIFCILSWVLNVLILVGAARLTKDAQSSFTESLGKAASEDVMPGIFMGLSVFIVAVLVARSQGGETAVTVTESGAVTFPAEFVEKVRGRIELDGTEPVRGDPAARFTLVEWADYECGHCGLMAPVLKQVLADNADVKLLFKHYPISSICNQFVGREAHQNACGAAAAAECARLQGRFWELNELLFANQEYLSADDLRFQAEKVGIDLAAFSECQANPASMDAVKADIAAGGVAQIDGTPSIFLSGAYGDTWVKINAGGSDRPLINALLAAAREGKPLPEPIEPHTHPE